MTFITLNSTPTGLFTTADLIRHRDIVYYSAE